MDPWGACATGVIGALIFMASSKLMVRLKIDDPLDACPIHGFCGAWGALAVGVFGTDANTKMVYGFDNDCISTWLQFRIQVVGVLAILAWTLGTSTILFLAIKFTIGLRVDEETEECGLDSKHGAEAYVHGYSSQTSPKDTASPQPQHKEISVGGVTAERCSSIGVTMEGVTMEGVTTEPLLPPKSITPPSITPPNITQDKVEMVTPPSITQDKVEMA